jgi:phosphoribosylaminoimidazole (AIR) synthetase
MPGFYSDGEYDVAGRIVGVVDMGIGMVVFIASADLPCVARIWVDAGQHFFAIGNVVGGDGRVVLEPSLA